MTKFGFKKGLSHLPNKDLRAVRRQIMAGLKIKKRVEFHHRMLGLIEPTISEAETITQIFASHGIDDIWGG